MDWIEVSTHASDRWHERTQNPGIGPRIAWINASPCLATGLHGDEFRYHEPTDTILIMKNGVLTTVLNGSQASNLVVHTTAEDTA